MKTIDYVLLFNAGIFMLFAGPHILADDGNVSAMGWDIAKFMPLKGRNPLPVPTEITLLISHICAILGSAQSSLIAMMLVLTLHAMLALARQRLFHTRLYFVYQCVCLFFSCFVLHRRWRSAWATPARRSSPSTP